MGVNSVSMIFETLNSFSSESPFSLYFIIPSLFYAYVNEVVILKKNKLSKIFLVLGGGEFILSLYIYFHASGEIIMEESYLYIIYELIGVLFSFFISLSILFKVKKNTKLLKRNYSNIENRDLLWIGQLIFFIVIFHLVLLVCVFSIREILIDIISLLMDFFIIYWISYKGFLQQVSYNFLNRELSVSTNKKTPIFTCNNKDLSKEKHTNYERILSKIDFVLKKEEMFLDTELTIMNVAEKVQEHPRLVSKTINTLTNQNFNSYINRYRVKYAKQVILEGSNSHLNLEGIGAKSGFKSNSSFYSAFRKEFNVTPSKYLKALN